MRIIQTADETAESCPAVASVVSSSLEIASASRGACIALDARATDDPQDDAIESYRFEYRVGGSPEDDGGSWIDVPGANGTDVLALTSAFQLTVPVSPERIWFRVTATDSTDAVGVSEKVSISFSNAKPVARPRASITLPAHGFDWAFGEDIPFYLDAGDSFDPDGDPIEFVWTLAGESGAMEPITTSERRYLHHVPAGSYGQVLATLRVRDGLVTSAERLESLERKMVVRLADPNVWSGPVKEPAPFTRLDTARRELYDSDDVLGMDAVFLPGQGIPVVVLASGDPMELLTAPWPDGSFTSVATLAGDNGDLLVMTPDPVHRRVWVVEREASPGVRVSAYDISADGLTATLRFTPLVFAQAPAFLPVGGDVDSSGSFWVSVEGDGTLGRIDADGTSETFVEPDAGFKITDLRIRPGTDELWSIEIAYPVSGPARIRRWNDGVPQGTLPLPSDLVFGLRWIDADQFWAFVVGAGPRLIDAGLFLETGSFEASVVASADFYDFGPFTVDPISGAIWIGVFNAEKSIRIDTRGTVQSFEGFGAPMFVDPAGVLWFEAEDPGDATTVLSCGFGPSRSATLLSFESFFSFADVDIRTGSLVVVTLFPQAIGVIHEDGSVPRGFRSLRFFDESGVAIPNGYPTAVRMHHGSSIGFILAGPTFFSPVENGIYRFDLEEETADGTITMRRVLGETVANLFAEDPRMFSVSSVGPGGTFLWVPEYGSGDTGSDDLLRMLVVETSGSVSTAFTVPVGQRNREYLGARANATNDYCLVTGDTAGQQYIVRRISKGGAVEVLGSIPGGPLSSRQVSAVANSTSADGNHCWVAIRDQSAGSNTVVSFRAPGMPGPTFTQNSAPAITALYPNSAVPPSLWISRDATGGIVDRTLVRFDATNAIVSSLTYEASERETEILNPGGASLQRP